ncbi:hypothetical protein [Microvirga antarctica]|uniref:hypothetical protein n=1 Tax=Microvirga antarctica TaxID=2819233 RepID=UPI001B300F05|nr:hypothetical protein [Microvirga antarctica]
MERKLGDALWSLTLTKAATEPQARFGFRNTPYRQWFMLKWQAKIDKDDHYIDTVAL